MFIGRASNERKISIILTESDLPDDKDFEILKNEEVIKKYKNSGGEVQKFILRRTVVWSDKHQDIIVLLSNCFHLEASEISLLYRKRWRIELLFKQLKRMFEGS